MTVTAEDFEEVRRLKSRYFRYIDTKDWAGLRSLFADDAVFDGFDYPTASPDEWLAGVRRFLTSVASVHQGFMPQLVERGPDVIRGIWSMEDYLVWAPGSNGYKGVSAPDQWGIHGYGHYEEEYSRASAGWRISFLRLTRLRIDTLTGAPAPLELQHAVLAPTAGWID